MAPPRPRQSVPKEKVSNFLAGLRTQSYHDTANRAPPRLTSIAWNPLGTLIATGATDRTLRVWNPEKFNIRYSTELKGHMSAIEKVTFNPVKEAELCSVSADGVVRFWDVKTKAIINEVKGLGDAFTLAWAPDGQSLIVGNKSDKLYILSPTSSTPLASHQQPSQTNQIAFCYSGTKVFLTTGEGRVKILSYPDFEPIFTTSYDPNTPFTLNGHTSSCISVEMQPTGRFLATGGADSIIALWDTTDWQCQRTLTDMVGQVRSISFTFDGTYIVGGSDEGNAIEVVHTETGETVFTIKTLGVSPNVSWHPNRYCLAYSDGAVLKILGIDSERK